MKSLANSFAGLHGPSSSVTQPYNPATVTSIDAIEPYCVADTGATSHMTSNPQLLQQSIPFFW